VHAAAAGKTKPESRDCHARTAPRLSVPGANHPAIDAEIGLSPADPTSTNVGMSVVKHWMSLASERVPTMDQSDPTCRSL